MSKIQAVLASHIISEHFGDLVNKVSAFLLQSGQRYLRDICKEVQGTRDEVCTFILQKYHRLLMRFISSGKDCFFFKFQTKLSTMVNDEQ